MDPDYQMALLLQEQYNQENARPGYGSDQQLAVILQEQFQQEVEVENPGKKLVYDKVNKFLNPTSSLVDPSWEVIDPTPDIHVLFMAFNERFFWKKLMSVCVSWCKRMTSCAGVCSYHGKGGFCHITLSEPLLKLRPRKDLVETLLHEMIHAYLFVTNNNKDRNGHGLEFHKHMFRINAEAGTNITVYHNFHDEVRLYQQHWWRCNGPCQFRRPYFGVVRRAINRAPGPNDRWWSEHQVTCGGTFTKVKEPEKKTQANKGKAADTKKKIKNNGNIKNFIASTSTNQIKTNEFPKSNIHTVASTNNNNKVNVVPIFSSKTSSNIHGFSSLSNNTQNNSKGITKNASKTVVINQTPTTSNVKTSSTTTGSSNNFNLAGTGKKLGDATAMKDYAAVRNHWLNKFGQTNPVPTDCSKSGNKRPISNDNNPKSPKAKKDESTVIQKSKDSGNVLSYEQCLHCGGVFSSKSLNYHVTKCPKNAANLQECFICGIKITADIFEQHVIKCASDAFQDDFDLETPNLLDIPKSDIKECSICRKKISAGEFATHMENCSKENLSGIIDLTFYDDNPEKFCPVCEKNVDAGSFENHIEICLHAMYDRMEKSYVTKKQTTKCLACGKDILKSELNVHLEKCMGDGFKDKKCDSNCDKKEYNCPFCMQVCPESEISNHINKCLATTSSQKIQEDKVILLDSFSSESEFEASLLQ